MGNITFDHLKGGLNQNEKTDRIRVVKKESAIKKQSRNVVSMQKTQQQLIEAIPELSSVVEDKIIRSELNLEKFADFIFCAPSSRLVKRARMKRWKVELDDGTTVIASLLIEPKHKGRTFTTNTRKVLLALEDVWYQRDKPKEDFKISSQEIARNLKRKWNGDTGKEIRRELEVLRTCFMTWKFSFVTPSGDKQTIGEPINILSRFLYKERSSRSKDAMYSQENIVAFESNYILPNLLTNKTRPVNQTAYMSIKNETAAVCYARFDVIMFGRTIYERRSEALFNDIGMLEGEYHYVSRRKRSLDKVKKELEGICISDGVMNIDVVKTSDGKDYKVVVRKTTFAAELPKPTQKKRITNPVANPKEFIPLLVEDISLAAGQSEKNKRFYELLARTYPQDMIYQAISELKDDGRDAENKSSYFSGILHRLAHQRGMEWIKECGSDCPRRSENIK